MLILSSGITFLALITLYILHKQYIMLRSYLAVEYFYLLILIAITAEIINIPSQGPEAHAATSYYVSPSGSGSSCSRSTPCSLDRGLQRVGAGDEVVLMDGVYQQMVTTVNSGNLGNPIVIRAENQHKAIIRKGDGNITAIKNNYLIIRGIRFDGQRTGGANGGIRIGYDGVSGIHHVVFEHNIVENMSRSCVHVTRGQHDLIIRHNLINGCGFVSHWGEAFYIGHRTDPRLMVYRLQIYGNDVRNFTENGVDLKRYSRDIEIHHNIFSGQISANKQGATQGLTLNPLRGYRNHGTLTLAGSNALVYNNILRNNKSGWGPLVVAPSANHKVFGNVAYDETSDRDYPTLYAIRAHGQGAEFNLGASELFNNTFCNLTSYAVQGKTGLNIYSNRGIPGSGVAKSKCDTEVQRILREMEQLPGIAEASPQFTSPLNLRLK